MILEPSSSIKPTGHPPPASSSASADDATTAPPPSQADIEKLLEAAPRYGVEIRVPHE